MNILMTGGTGFIGKRLCQALKEQGFTLWVLTRQERRKEPQVTYFQHFSDIQADQHFDAVINLAGEPIAQRWTVTHQNRIRDSRIKLTQMLVDTLSRLNKAPKVLISGSAIGFYGPQDEKKLTETATYQPSFSHQLCQDWEEAADKASKIMRVCYLRTGVVLGPSGGMLAKMRFSFLLGLGGPIGSGKQWISWIHIDDLIRVIVFCLKEEHLSGPVNATAPDPVTNETFARSYAKILHRPCFLRMPAPLIQILMGKMGEELLLAGQKVVPQKLLNNGFHFLYPSLEEALKAIEMPANDS